ASSRSGRRSLSLVLLSIAIGRLSAHPALILSEILLPSASRRIDRQSSFMRVAAWPIGPARRLFPSGAESPSDPASLPPHSSLLSYPLSMSNDQARPLRPRLAAIALDISRAALDLR